MNKKSNQPTRRDALAAGGAATAASVLAGASLVNAYVGENNTIKVALVGCGGRGTGAAGNALSVRNGPIRLVAMADLFADRLNPSYARLQRQFAQQMDVPESRRFLGFDAYRRAMDCLDPGDVVILATPPAFRWVHFAYAIQKRINVFMEKPVTVDGGSTRRMLDLIPQSERLNLKVGVGLMCRHCAIRQDLYNRIRDGAIGDITMLRAYRMQGPIGSCFSPPCPRDMPELHYQIRRFHSFLWASGGSFSDFFIHNIDECCWMKDAWPVKAKGTGGRHYRGNFVDQNFDHYSVEYTFEDGTKLYLNGRNMSGCHNEFASYAHGTRGSAIISRSGHTPARCRLYRSHNFTNTDSNVIWRAPRQEPNPYQLEWDHLIAAIRNDQRYNEARRGVEASLVTAMGRLACHTGQEVTRDQVLNAPEFAPNVDRLQLDGPAPLRADENGKYPVPQPGILRTREY